MLPEKGCGSNLAICRWVPGDSSVPAWIFRKFNMEAFSRSGTHRAMAAPVEQSELASSSL